MKTFQQYITENNRPGGAIVDRSLEGFRYLMDGLKEQTKGVLDPNAKQEINIAVHKFYEEMRQILVKYKRQNIGYSPNYQPNGNQLNQPQS